jgi:predicted phosphodiesterase
VRGNVDAASLEFPPSFTQRYGDVEIHMLHELPKAQSALRNWAQAGSAKGKQAEQCCRFLASFPEECRVVIFGHSHEPCAQVLWGKLFFNPGSAGKKRFSLPRCFGILEISTRGVGATFLGLERYNEDLPEGAWLPIEGA